MKTRNRILLFFFLTFFFFQPVEAFWVNRVFIYTNNSDDRLDDKYDKLVRDEFNCGFSGDSVEGKIIYEWNEARNLDDWIIEGVGDIGISSEGALWVHTKNGIAWNGKKSRQLNVWLKDIELPDKYEVEWSYKCEKVGNLMVIFNAQPFLLTDLFEDPRVDANYDDLAANKKIVCYTIGFNRPGGPSVFRKLGGDVPEAWNGVVYNTPDWINRDSVTTLNSTKEPAIPAPEGANEVHYKLRNENGRVRFWINEQLVHDTIDKGQYPYHTSALRGGRIAFRNFSGVSHDYYTSIIVREL